MNKTMVAEFDNLNYYEILEISMSASSLEVRQAYEEAFSMYSEDSLVTYSLFGDKEREEILKRIEEAFATLIDREKRAEYDRNLVDIAGQNHKAGPVRDTGLKTSNDFPGNVTTVQGLLSNRVAQKAHQQDTADVWLAVDIDPDNRSWQGKSNDDGGFGVIPEPLTMLGVCMGIGGLGQYIRKRRMA